MRRVSKSKSLKLKSESDVSGLSKRKATSSGETGDASAENGKNDADIVDSDGESEEAESFEVAEILASRARHGKRQFKIRWKGYGPADDTWEDEENVNSPDLIAAFMKGTDEDKPPAKSPKKQAKKRGASASAKASPKPTKKVKPENGSDDDAEWEVSKIIDYVTLKDGTRQFHVRWKGYSSKDDTWEPEANLNCPELIQKYMDREEEREETSRETRENRRQVNRYNPELTKRSSHRTSTRKRISYHDLE